MIHYSFIVVDSLSRLAETELRRRLARLRELGYEGVEFNANEPLGVDAGRLQGWCADLDLAVPSLLTGEAYGRGLCLSAADDEVRRRTVARLKGYLDLAARFDACLVVGLLQGLRSDEPDPQLANRRIVEGLRQVAAAAETRGVDLVIEPVNHLQVGFNNSVAEVCALIDAIGSAAVRPMVDTIHMNVEESSLVEPILRCGDRLRHVHLCESNGALFGTGHIDFASVLEALRRIDYDRFASVKIYRGATFDAAAASSLDSLRAAAG